MGGARKRDSEVLFEYTETGRGKKSQTSSRQLYILVRS